MSYGGEVEWTYLHIWLFGALASWDFLVVDLLHALNSLPSLLLVDSAVAVTPRVVAQWYFAGLFRFQSSVCMLSHASRQRPAFKCCARSQSACMYYACMYARLCVCVHTHNRMICMYSCRRINRHIHTDLHVCVTTHNGKCINTQLRSCICEQIRSQMYACSM